MALTKKWSGVSYDGRDADEIYLVDGVGSLAAARIYSGVPQINTSYPDNTALKSQRPRATRVGFNLYEVLVHYAIPESGDWNDVPTDPLNEPATWWWEQGSVTEPIDYAYDGSNNRTVPIVNSAFDAIDPAIMEEFGTLFLHVEKTLEDMPLPTAIQYQNATNLNAFTILGRYDVAAGQCRCIGVMPVSAQTQTSSSVRVRLTLEFREDGFKSRILDQGYNSFNVAGDKLPIVDAQGNRFSEPKRLDGKGKPMDSTVKVGPNSPELPAINPAGATITAVFPSVTTETTANAVFLRYKKKKALDFAPLLTMFN